MRVVSSTNSSGHLTEILVQIPVFFLLFVCEVFENRAFGGVFYVRFSHFNVLNSSFTFEYAGFVFLYEAFVFLYAAFINLNVGWSNQYASFVDPRGSQNDFVCQKFNTWSSLE